MPMVRGSRGEEEGEEEVAEEKRRETRRRWCLYWYTRGVVAVEVRKERRRCG